MGRYLNTFMAYFLSKVTSYFSAPTEGEGEENKQ